VRKKTKSNDVPPAAMESETSSMAEALQGNLPLSPDCTSQMLMDCEIVDILYFTNLEAGTGL
jgi:hypothetical protein